MTPEEVTQLRPGDVLRYVFDPAIAAAYLVVLNRFGPAPLVQCLYDPDMDRINMRWSISTPEYYTLVSRATDD